MNHGSSHVFMYDVSDEEVVSDAEMQEGMWLSESDEDDDDDEPIPRPACPPPPSPPLNPERYVDLDHFPTGLPPPPPHSSQGAITYAEVKVKPQQFTTPHQPPPVPSVPPAPRKGLIKNRIPENVRRKKKKHVQWEKTGQTRPMAAAAGRRRMHQADTNVLAVTFNTLTGPSHIHTGDSVACGNENCSAVLSHLSKLKDIKAKASTEKMWVCEFCGTENSVDIVQEEVPSEEHTTYMLAAPASGGGAQDPHGAIVVFCVDVSGSMCVTTEVPGKFELKGHEQVRMLSYLNQDHENQYMPHQRRDVTYVSRLQSVQAAVNHQLESLSTHNPSQRVALVTFGDEVTVIGDGQSEVVTVAGDRLNSSNTLVRIGGEAPFPAAVQSSKDTLSTKVFGLEEGGQTALGPAILLSVTLASRAPGSKVVICTDGLANKGVGNLYGLHSDEDRVAAQAFYEDLGLLALEKGVTVSLVTIKGTDCRTLELGQVAYRTRGQVTIVDPLTITQEFSSILANHVIATDVTTKIILHRQLYFRTEKSKDSVLTIPVGNVTATTELTYEYGVRKKKTLNFSQSRTVDGGSSAGTSAVAVDKRVPPLMVGGQPHLPFQMQITYTRLDGSQCMCVVTQAKPTTRDRKVAEKGIDIALVGAHANHTMARLAMEGEYTGARTKALSAQRLLQRTSHETTGGRWIYQALMTDVIPLENEIRDRLQSERERFGRQHSDDEDEEEQYFDHMSEISPSSASLRRKPSKSPFVVFKPEPKKKKAISRRMETSDILATYCYEAELTSPSNKYRCSDVPPCSKLQRKLGAGPGGKASADTQSVEVQDDMLPRNRDEGLKEGGREMKKLCRAPGCSFKPVKKLNGLCQDCHDELYQKI